MRDINSGLLFSGVLTSPPPPSPFHSILPFPLTSPFASFTSLDPWPASSAQPTVGPSVSNAVCENTVQISRGESRAEQEPAFKLQRGVQRPSSPPLMWSTQCDKLSEVPTLWQNWFNFEKTLRRDKMNKLPHIMTVFISESQITRCCRPEDKLAQVVGQTYSSELVCINIEYSGVPQEELGASHMTRYTSLQGLIIIIFIFSSGSKQIFFAILGYGNVSALGPQFSMSQLT